MNKIEQIHHLNSSDGVSERVQTIKHVTHDIRQVIVGLDGTSELWGNRYSKEDFFNVSVIFMHILEHIWDDAHNYDRETLDMVHEVEENIWELIKTN